MHTYPEMNEDIVAILRISDSPIKQYAALRIEELEAGREALVKSLEGAEQTLRNLARGFLTGDTAVIASNEAANLRDALERVKGK